MPVEHIVPDYLLEKLQKQAVCIGSSVSMLLASLLPATACALGSATQVLISDLWEERLGVASLFMIVAADPGRK